MKIATETADPETLEPEAAVDPVIDPAVAPAPDPGEPPPSPEPAPRKDHWALRRISEESEKARQAQERASAAERRAQQAEELAERLRNGQTPPAGTPAPRPEAQADRQAEIRAEAARQRLYEDSSEVVSRGVAEYGPAFAETQRALAALGAATDDFVLDVMAVDRNNAHKLFKEIADDPERAIALAGMSSRQRLVELGKMTVKAAPVSPVAPASTSAIAPARRVSAAPAPAPHVTPSAAPAAKDGYDDSSSDADFDKQFFGRWKDRTARR